MRKLIGSAVLLAALMPAVAAAQHRAMSSGGKHEFGVDLAFLYSKPSGGTSSWGIGTPVDVRIGFVGSGSIMFEPRFTLAYAHSSGASIHDFDLGLNLLYGKDHHKGMYLTAGASADLTGATGFTSGSVFSVNGGIGTRSPYESGAFRLEAFVKYDLKNTKLGSPNTLNIGARVGLSLWH